MKKKRKNYNPMYEVEIGQKFGMLTALNSTSHRGDIITLKCECGKIKSMEAIWLFKGNITNCGCVLTTRPKYYEWFEEQMDKWDPTCHRTDMKRLPYFKATKRNNPHMTIDGWTYVDNYTYEFAKNIVWTKGNYIITTLSRFNCYKLGINYRPAKDGYRRRIFLHNWVAGLVPVDGKLMTDHINGLKLDNRPDNLRVATSMQNSVNSKPSSITGFKGVKVRRTSTKSGEVSVKYVANAVAGGIPYYLGSYDTPDAAAEAVDLWSISMYGEFTRLNLKRSIYENKGVLPKRSRIPLPK